MAETLTLTPLTSHESAVPVPPEERLVPPLNPRAVDGPYYQKLYGPGIKWGLSIETAELNFPHTSIPPRSVYGTIHINEQHGCLHTLYNRRSEDEAENLPSPSGGYLTLSGPRYFLSAPAPTSMYVTLYQVGTAVPFLHRRVPLDLSKVSPAQTIPVSVGELTVVMTVITPAALTDISLDLYCHHSEWLVSGSVTAIQTTSQGKKTRRVPLFYRPLGDPMRADGRISPDRKAFIAPLLFEKSLMEKKNRALRDAGLPSSGNNPDNDFYNGVGSFLSVDVDLRFVDEGKSCIVRGLLHYQFKCTHEDGAIFRASVKGRVFTKLPRLSTDEEEEIEVVVSLKPWLDISCSMDGEPDECDMPLYIKPIYVHSDTDSDSE